MSRQSRARQLREAQTERHRLEEIGWARRAVELAVQNRNLQVAAIAIAAIGVVAAVLTVWSPWTTTPAIGARVSMQKPSGNAVVARPIAAISRPPWNQGLGAYALCQLWWKRWFIQENAAPVEGYPLIEISAPGEAAVTITSARVRVYSSSDRRKASLLICNKGAGVVPGTLLTPDLADPSAVPTIVSDTGSNVPLSMPDAVITIPAGHTEFVRVTPRGMRDRLYRWSLTLTIVVNQRSKTYSFGSAKHPLFSWSGPAPLSYVYTHSSDSWEEVGF
jgi:hypothetical protein